MNWFEKLGIGALKGVFTKWSKSKLPKIEGSIKVKGLTNEVEIIRDKWGIPHIYASNLKDVLFAQGFVHAQDRLWQIELNRRAARGTLSEFIGKDALDADRLSRTLGFERVGRQDWDLFDNDQHEILKAYCHGVNAWMNNKHFKKPLEFSLLKLDPKPFEPIDIVSISRLLTSQMTWGWYDELVRAKLIEAIGQDAAAELDCTYLNKAITLPNGIEFNQIKLDSKMKDGGNYTPNFSGSNAWTISGNNTTTGKPFLCNDPHLVVKNPNIWYEIHLDCPELKVTGVSIPGAPMVQIGHNENIGWGITLSFTDLEDLFIEKFTDASMSHHYYKNEKHATEIIEEKISIKGETKPHIERIYKTKHGVVISEILGCPDRKLALQSMSYQPSKALWGWFELNHAKNYEDFSNAIKYWSAPGLNIVYADIAGNIGYYNSGKVSVKTKEQASIPMLGDNGKNDWDQFIPFNEMPHVLNPKNGYVVTCNNKIEPDDFPHYLGDIYMNGYRAERLENMILQKQGKLGILDFVKMQTDVECLPGIELAKHFEGITFEKDNLENARKILVNWNGVLDKQSIGGTIYKVVKNHTVNLLLEKIIDDKSLIKEVLGEGFDPTFSPSNPFVGHNTSSLLHLLNKNERSIVLNQYGGKDQLLTDGFTSAIKWLESNLGVDSKNWKWSSLHQMEIPHALSVKKPMDKIFNLGPYPIGGDTDTPLQTYPEKIGQYDGEIVTASYRQIIDFSDFDNSISITPVGQSGNLASPYYGDQTEDWLNGKFHTMCWTKSEVKKHQKHILKITTN